MYFSCAYLSECEREQEATYCESKCAFTGFNYVIDVNVNVISIAKSVL